MALTGKSIQQAARNRMARPMRGRPQRGRRRAGKSVPEGPEEAMAPASCPAATTRIQSLFPSSGGPLRARKSGSRYSKTRVAVPRKHHAKRLFPQEVATSHTPCWGTFTLVLLQTGPTQRGAFGELAITEDSGIRRPPLLALLRSHPVAGHRLLRCGGVRIPSGGFAPESPVAFWSRPEGEIECVFPVFCVMERCCWGQRFLLLLMDNSRLRRPRSCI